nr:site-specific integrase [Lachnospiraceae bacterium]
HHRLKSGGVEIMLKKMGKQTNVTNCYPHKFRRTMATTAIDKGMPVEQVQKLLGHDQIDTTMQYAMVKQSNVKISHKRYIG